MNNKSHIVDLLLDTAQGFYDIGFSCAAYLKNDEGRTVIQRTPVGAVNLSFAAELYFKCSTIVSSQLPVSTWYDIIGEGTIADAILDRLVNSSHRIDLTGQSMRKGILKNE